MSEDASKQEKNIFRWCEKREQHVALAVCRSRAKTKKACLKCMAEYNQLPLFPKSMLPPDPRDKKGS